MVSWLPGWATVKPRTQYARYAQIVLGRAGMTALRFDIPVGPLLETPPKKNKEKKRKVCQDRR